MVGIKVKEDCREIEGIDSQRGGARPSSDVLELTIFYSVRARQVWRRLWDQGEAIDGHLS